MRISACIGDEPSNLNMFGTEKNAETASDKCDYLGLTRALANAWRTLKLTRKSDREEFSMYLKLVLIGFGVVGTIGFIIYFVASMVMLIAGVPNPNPSGSTVPAILLHF